MLSKSELAQYAVCVGFSVTLCVVFSLGVSYLVAASENKHDSEVEEVEGIIDDWNLALPDFKELQVNLELGNSRLLLPSTINDFTFDDDDLTYDHYKYYTNATSLPANYDFYVTFNRQDVSSTQPNEFNLTATLKLTVTALEDATTVEISDDVLVLERKKNNANSKSEV